MRLLAAVAVSIALTQTAHADDPPPPAPAGTVTKLPKLVQAMAPEYPAAALAAKKTAKVKVRLHIDADGVVTAVDVLEHVGDGFDEAAVAAAEQYLFEPAEIDGKPAAIAVETAINFTIDEQTVPDEPPRPPPPHATTASTNPPNHGGDMAKPITLEGVAMERGTRTRLAGVIVSIAELGLDVVTDQDGAFFFHGIPPGAYKVIAVDDKHDRLERGLDIAKREKLEVRLWMRPAGGNLYETVVEGERETLEVTKRTLQRQQLTSVPGTFGDPIRAIQTLPGIARAPFGLGLLLIRGSNPDDTGIMVDGHEVPALFHFLGGPSIFNAEMLESIDLYPGGFPARFGRHHGGIVDLELRPTESDGVHGSAKVDFIDAGGYVRAPITKDLSVAFAGRRSYIDAFLGLILPDPGPGSSRLVAPVYYDYSGRIDYNLHGDGRLAVFAIGSSDTLHVLQKDADQMTSTDLNSAIKFFRVIGEYTRPFGGGDLKLTMSPAWGRDTVAFSGAQAEASGPFSSIAVVNSSLSYRMRVHGRLSKRVAIDTGVDLLSRVTTYSALLPLDDNITVPQGADIPPTQLFRGSQSIGAAVHGDAGIDATDRLRIVPGLRIDGYILDGAYRHSIDPRITAKYRVSPEWTLKAYVGHFSQPPQPEALDRRFGNPNVGIEHAEHYGLGYEWRPDKLWSLDSEIYWVHRHHLVVFTDDIVRDADGGYAYVNFKNSGVRDAYGLEAILKREISPHLYGWLTYTFSRSTQKNEPDDLVSPTTFDQPHVMNAVVSWKPGGGFEIGGRFQFASGRPTTPTIGSTYDGDTGTYVPVRGDDRSQRVPDFEQLDVRVARAWLFDRWSIEAYLDVINATYAKNVEAYQYDYRFRERAAINGFPILPTLGVKGTW